MKTAMFQPGLLTMFLTCVFSALLAAEEIPGERWTAVTPVEAGLDAAKLNEARDYALTGGGSGYITRGGKLVIAWGDLKKRYDLKSTTKSFGATALGLAVLDGKIALTDKVTQHHPAFGTPPQSNAETGWIDKITVLHLATQTAGFEKLGGYTKLIFEPGTKWSYSDGGPNWLAECVTLAYRQDVDKLMFDRVFTPLGITRNDLAWRKNSYRDKEIEGIPRREFGSGISANVDAMARVGLLYLRGGMWNGNRILPEEYVKQVGTTVPAVVGLPEVDPKTYGDASDHYGRLWWNNADGTLKDVPRDAYWTWGLYDSLIVVIPSLDIVVARAGQSWKRNSGDDHYAVLEPFLGPIAAAAKQETVGQVCSRTFHAATEAPFNFVSALPQQEDLLERKTSPKKTANAKGGQPAAAPYPPSPVVAGIEWAPVSSIVRKARGGDNWPITWADDDNLYTAYGDGKVHAEVAEACDFLAPHWNGTKVGDIPARVAALKRFGKPVVCNEDDRIGKNAVAALRASVESGCGYGLMLKDHNQTFPFHFDGAANDPVFYVALKEQAVAARAELRGAATDSQLVASVSTAVSSRNDAHSSRLPRERTHSVFSVREDHTGTLLNRKPFLAVGLRVSNTLVSDAATDELIRNLDTFAEFGVNRISVFFQGSRFGDVRGYREDSSLDPVYAARMGRIIEAADARRMVVLVGCLYHGDSKSWWKTWKQADAERAVANTIGWLKQNQYRNVFVDVNNEHMASFDDEALIAAGKAVDASLVITTSGKVTPANADLSIHHGRHDLPNEYYIETEGTGGNYWGSYSKQPGLYDYINIGVYSDEMKREMLKRTDTYLDHGQGYLFASTWLQNPPPGGPHHAPGGIGTKDDPGVRWWLEHLRTRVGPYRPDKQ